MDDPWAGPSWSTPSKPSSAIAMTMPSTGRTTPPPRFDDSDPWGVTHVPQAEQEPTRESVDKEQEDSPKKSSVETPGWGGENHEPWGGVKSEHEESPSPPEGSFSPEPYTVEDQQPTWDTSKSPIKRASSSSPPISPKYTTTSAAPSPQREFPSPTFPTSSPPPQPLPTFQDQPFASTSANLSPIPKSPSFGDDFGGFSAGPSFSSGGDDPWGNNSGPSTTTVKADSGSGGWGGEELSWGGGRNETSWRDTSFGEEGETSFKSPIIPQEEDLEEEEEGEGWGGARPARTAVVEDRSRGDDDWEVAHRKIRVMQERAPKEKTDGLTQAWTDLLGSLIQTDLEKMTGAEELQFEEMVKKLDEDTIDRLRSLSTIPPDINTYPPVLSSLMTHERYVYALQRPNPSPSTSLLTITAPRRPTRIDPLALASSSAGPSWTSRSMLGEPDAPPQDHSSQQEEQNKSRWSFWGKRPVPERQLTTSGGGVLERKSISLASPDLNGSSERHSTDIKPPSSRAPSISIASSRPNSPAPSSLSVTNDNHDIGHSAPSGTFPQTQTQAQPPQQPVQAAPSAVSRFFGRLSRNKSQPSTQEAEESSNKDLELSADDFSFLSEVPSLKPPEKGVGDLLALEPGRNEQIASLESLLSSKPTQLPKPLAPPPKGPAAASGQRSNSGRFVARMKSPPPTDFDLLGDLNFSGSTHTQSTSSATQSPMVQSPAQGMASPSNAWDDFLSLDSAPKPTVKSPTTPIIAPPLVPSRSNTPSVSLSPPPPPPPNPAISSIVSKPTPATPVRQGGVNDFTNFDFDDFGTPQHASTSTFDDFGDFSTFESTTPAPVPTIPSGLPSHLQQAQTQTPLKSSAINTPGSNKLSTPANHARPGSLDHTPTLNLVTGASASKGKRWPAPPSPVAPAIAPPPKPSNSTAQAGFPFLSPPPPGRPNSRLNNLLDDGAQNTGTPASASSGNDGLGLGSPVFGGSLQPSRTATPTPQVVASAISPTELVQGGGKGGLSAQDLSFFDSL
ncbi:hypothetical protein I302_108073 [Kwoniella bestiolae CBS 10118]|uniref:Uncharacterized protein n=1 Tax=Kwoniella bestiolae CBS 10118 TaxID=1296100 RepID=A0A1B9FWQ9_9TREE|nr:hypothetical protein I302_07561 [Kwoniella bestiolae CBS 10118]OCF23207.1 hypothetical protein I302_07561 [Kwoniella bestiolae CBS 10118]